MGVPPKEFLKIIRFQQALAEIERHKNISWTTLAIDCGFYDQSHFIADFKTFSGFTPQEYIRQKKDNTHYIPVV